MKRSFPWSRRRIVWIVIALAGVLIVLLPSIICQLGYVQPLVNRQLARRQLTATINSVSVGWLSPLRLHELEVHDDASTWQLTARSVSGELSLWDLLWNRAELGTLVVDSPQLTVALDQPLHLPTAPDEPGGASGEQGERQLRLKIHDGTIFVRSAELSNPQQVATHVELDAAWSAADDGKRLTIMPGQILDHVELSPEMCTHGLKYIAPVVADTAWTRGSLSLKLDDCTIDVEHPAASNVSGNVTLHAVETGLRSPLAKSIAATVAAATKRKLPESVRLADESVVQFSVANGQIHHSGLEFGLPELSRELVIGTHGDVGFDKSLNLVADIPLPLELLGEGPLAQALGNQTLHLPVRGTLDKPEIKAEGDGDVASEVLSQLLNPVLEGDVKLDDVVEGLQELRDQWKTRRRERGPLFPRLRPRN